jgi:hypothetical protein
MTPCSLVDVYREFRRIIPSQVRGRSRYVLGLTADPSHREWLKHMKHERPLSKGRETRRNVGSTST